LKSAGLTYKLSLEYIDSEVLQHLIDEDEVGYQDFKYKRFLYSFKNLNSNMDRRTAAYYTAG